MKSTVVFMLEHPSQELLRGAPGPSRLSRTMMLQPGVMSLSTHSYGCRVIQRVLERSEIDDLKVGLPSACLGHCRARLTSIESASRS